MKSFRGKMVSGGRAEIISIDEGVRQWQNYNAARNLSPRSIEFYDECHEMFQSFYDCAKPCRSLEEEVIYEYIAFLRQRGVKDTTVNSYMRAARAMCYYFMKIGYTAPFQVTLVKSQKTVKETYTDHELVALLAKPAISKVTFVEYRNWVLVNYLLATGNRESTVCNIKIKDIDFDSDTIHLTHTKSRREQLIPMSKTIRGVLMEYLKYREGEPDDWLFCNVNGAKLSADGLKQAIHRYNKKRGVEKTSVHLFRHTFAKKWILNGGDIFRLQRILGHSSMDIVREYVNMFGDDLKRDFDTFNPLEEFGEGKKTVAPSMRKRR